MLSIMFANEACI